MEILEVFGNSLLEIKKKEIFISKNAPFIDSNKLIII
jgi:hypothetical protein